ncbi:endonuclease domain-containing protein [Subtercola sp. PAMC28395]|uniref:endonuclease domain-containing protein n=1 Tax=Subtercola sp. PAMC28395 TaxID=2846775 RepID=UPI001C0D2F0B|nr:endonuclease domain-containing protein [Subtercola sp. PAMC28395]QWT24072.1 endonuclease domain-containing protein [Subtercola sp. PAMC28395]
MTEEMALTVIDSALNKSRRYLIPERITQRTLQAAAETLPERYRRTIEKADPLSQSGLETLVRLRLRSRGIRVTTQKHHPGVGHVDLLVGDRLVIEVDGRETHDTDDGFATDRVRDLRLFSDDVRCLRLTYAQVMHDWPTVEPIILSKIRRRDHRWGRGINGPQREWARRPLGYT